jgi:hypothetical protein
MITMKVLEVSNTEEEEDNPIWFDSAADAVACMDIMFGEYLPPQFNVWEDLGSDAGMRSLCLFGVGAWYLTRARSSSDSGHDVTNNAFFECSLEYLSKYETRRNWITYGHTLYLGAPQEGDILPGDIVGIWSCHHHKLFVPGDSLWEHAKTGFRCSLGTSITLKDHLATCHWIVANSLMMSTRQCLTVDHPLRRLLKQFSYGTASINDNSKDILLPLGRLGHRTFGFSDRAWIDFFEDIFTSWTWMPFPEKMRQKGLGPDLLQVLPLSQDGELFWRTCEKYVEAYLRIFYPTDSAILADPQVLVFWTSFDGHFNALWQLPELSFASLVSFVTDLIWWVTGGHELVGSLVEYLCGLSGLPGKLMDGKDVPDVQSFSQALIIIALTGMREPPLMDDWAHLFKVDSWKTEEQQAVLNTVRQFQVDLAACSDEIEHQNMMRMGRGEKQCVAFDPRIHETSVSI